MKLNRVLGVIAVLLGCAGVLPAQTESLASIFTNATRVERVPPRRASIVFIAFHGLTYSDLSCYGQTNFQTPNIDRLAAKGTRYTNYRLSGDDLAEVQAALMEGNTNAFVAGQTTLADRMHNAGYRTGLFGEWLLGSQPWTQGFDDWGGFLSEAEGRNYYSDFFWRYSPKSIVNETNNSRSDFVGREMIYPNTGGRKGKYIPDFFMAAIGNFCRRNEPDFANHFRPFFLLVNLPAPQSATPGKDDYPVPTDAPFTDEPWPQAAKNRAALMTRLDASMGRLIEQLDKLNLSNSVAIFLAGASAPEKFAGKNMNFLQVKGDVRGGKSEARLGVPMIVYWPGHVPAGRVSPLKWDTTDFAPTVLQIAYGKPAPNYTGKSIWPELLGKKSTNAPASSQ